jgi:hypothetical protein
MLGEASTTEPSERLSDLLIRIVRVSRQPGCEEKFYPHLSSIYVGHTSVYRAYRSQGVAGRAAKGDEVRNMIKKPIHSGSQSVVPPPALIPEFIGNDLFWLYVA